MRRQAAETEEFDVQLVYFDDCPNWRTAEARLGDALRIVGGHPASVRRVVVRSPEEAPAAGLHGSPTILINGRDPFAGPAVPVLLATGAAAAVGGVLVDCWPLVVLGVAALVVFVVARRRGRTGQPR